MNSGNSENTIKVSVAYATSSEQMWRDITLSSGSTLHRAIEKSGILSEFPEIDLDNGKVGVFGAIKDLDTVLRDGDRVEIYRPITIDPEKLERRKYKLRKVEPIIETRGNVRKL